MTALEIFQAEYPFPHGGVCAEKEAWYGELALFQLRWNAHARTTNASLTIARELIAALTHDGGMSPRLMTPETKGLWKRWQAEEMK